jgi:hypothetical protein
MAQPICEQAPHSLVAHHSENSPRIILNEGASEIATLRNSLEVLSPRLVSSYSFLDFDGKMALGEGAICQLRKGFAAAGISTD